MWSSIDEDEPPTPSYEPILVSTGWIGPVGGFSSSSSSFSEGGRSSLWMQVFPKGINFICFEEFFAILFALVVWWDCSSETLMPLYSQMREIMMKDYLVPF